MTGVLLFCISEEAKQLTRKMLTGPYPNRRENGFANCLFVNSYKVPDSEDNDKGKLRDTLDDNDDMITELFGADLIFIANERSAKDGILLAQYWPPENSANLVPVEYESFGSLPKELHEWYEYRFDTKLSEKVQLHLLYLDEEMMYPVYLGRKEKFTNESGIFDVARADRIFHQREPGEIDFKGTNWRGHGS
ncbi:hypothetical protein BT63DRAFT_450466 [Microthyrium microscopicum]|uniref:Uncharacterized protein n=1 Tax=Microthyrium microscopicum TaxID=703497 RepID=A0A6A6UT16_9PEZI|nr:hypothetical protein BT63DRAFT_450466 [Microthyrium microscopicum]